MDLDHPPMHLDGFQWESIKRPITDSMAPTSSVKKGRHTACGTNSISTAPEEHLGIDWAQVRGLRPFPPLEDYLDYIHLNESQFNTVLDILHLEHVDNWSYFLHSSHVDSNRLVDWGLPHPIAVDLLDYAPSYYLTLQLARSQSRPLST